MDQKHHQEYLKKRESMFQDHAQAKAKKRRKIKLIVLSLVLLIVSVSIFTTFNYYTKPGPYDNFAKCLKEKGAVMYGAIEWCKYTQGQAHMFGKSFQYINYQDASKLPGLKTSPTWVIDGKWYEKVQSFETLSSVTGCPL
jgi:hypothetical protein